MEYDKIKSEFEKIQKEIVKDVNPIFKRLIKKQDDLRDEITPIDYKEWNPPCGIFEHTATLTEEQKQEADELVDVVVTEILEDPNEKDEIVGMAKAADSKGQAGTEKGDRTGYVEFLRLRFPNWLKDIKTSLGAYFSQDKKRKGIDWEETVKNVIRKPKFKMQNPADSLYVFVDTSGSMWGYTDRNGVGLLKLFGSYFPQIAQKYNGQIWFSDVAPYNSADPISKAVELSDFKKDDISRFDFGGGGGTVFWGVWQYFDKKVREAKEKDPKARVMLIFFSDMEADFETYPELILDKDVLFVTVEGKGEELMRVPNMINGKERRLIFADTDPESRK